MTLDKAIEILEKEQEDTFMGSERDWKDAVKLGIKALQRFQGLRAAGHYVGMPLLKGETEE